MASPGASNQVGWKFKFHFKFGKFGTILKTLLSLILFGVALTVIARELRTVGWQELERSFSEIPPVNILAVLFLTPVAYLLLTGYDLVAFQFVGHPLSWRRVLFAAFVGYAYSNSISMTPSIAVRYRLYSHWGVSKGNIAKVVFFHYVSTWIGFISVAGWVLLLERGPIAGKFLSKLDHPAWLGAGLIGLIVLYLWFGLRHRVVLRFRGVEFPLPSGGVVVSQTLLASADWAVMGTIPYLLLPIHSHIPYFNFVAVFLFAQVIQILSHVPGGVGVFESVMLVVLKPYATSAAILAALVVYRMIFMLAPLGIASLLLLAFEWKKRRGGP